MVSSKQINTRKLLVNFIYTVAGCLLTAIGLVMFTIPNHIAPGGSSGLATSLAVFVPLSVGLLTWLVNVPILIACIRTFGLQSGLKTLTASTMLSFFMEILTSYLPIFTDNKLMAAVLGGILIGSGIGIAFLKGISMGGTDQLSILLSRVFKNASTAYILMICDSIVVVIAALTFRDLEVFLYSIICVFVASKAIDTVMEGMNHAKVFFIITDYGQAIADALNSISDNGCTMIRAQGTYTRTDKQVLMTVVHPNTASQTLEIIQSIDENAFTFMSAASEVHGKGFKHYRADGEY